MQHEIALMHTSRYKGVGTRRKRCLADQGFSYVPDRPPHRSLQGCCALDDPPRSVTCILFRVRRAELIDQSSCRQPMVSMTSVSPS